MTRPVPAVPEVLARHREIPAIRGARMVRVLRRVIRDTPVAHTDRVLRLMIQDTPVERAVVAIRPEILALPVGRVVAALRTGIPAPQVDQAADRLRGPAILPTRGTPGLGDLPRPATGGADANFDRTCGIKKHLPTALNSREVFFFCPRRQPYADYAGSSVFSSLSGFR